MPEEILFIVNPRSGVGNKNNLPGYIDSLLDSSKWDAKIIFTEYAGHAAEIAGKYRNIKSAIIAVGGDGTVNEIAHSLAGSNTALGIIPAGSGNGLARHLKIPLDTSHAVKLLNNAKIQEIDTCSVNDHFFACTAGVGFDAKIGAAIKGKKIRGFKQYINIALREFFTYKPEQYLLETDSGKLERVAYLITAANAAQYGNNALIAPEADIQDGFIDVSIVKPFPKYLGMQMIWRLFSGKMSDSKYVETFKTKTLKITRVQEGPAHVDGEALVLGTNLVFSINEKNLKMITSGNA